MGLDEDLERFAGVADRFLRAGGRLTFREFLRRSDDEQAVCARLGDELAAVRAVQLARAFRSPADEAGVLAPFDDGASMVCVGLAAFLDGLGA